MAAPAAALMEMDELVEEFLIRLPPDDPASLVRAALVSKLWRRILAGRGFRRRFRDFHRMPRLLGVVHCRGRAAPRFATTSAFRPRNTLRLWYVQDSHHGRILSVHPLDGSEMDVWDPITGEKLQLCSAPPAGTAPATTSTATAGTSSLFS
ncbi:uncharacterized protein [Miscanthus floridulus]|uniref:uncharacterized protein n=1 Tax=Miscanthus floridulus TaxID=154761 RepID=UPI00345AFEF3